MGTFIAKARRALPWFSVVFGASILSSLGCARVTLTPGEVATVAKLPIYPVSQLEIETWIDTYGNPRSLSIDLDGAFAYLETALGSDSSIERVSFFFSREPWRLEATLAWLRHESKPPPNTGGEGPQFWGLTTRPVAGEPNQFYVPGIHGMLHLNRATWVPPVEPPNPRLPQDVIVKTPGLTFYRDQLFAVDDGKIWFKRNPARGGTLEEPWRLFHNGLPRSGASGGVQQQPARIVALAADGDDLLAIADGGRVFLCTTASDSWTSVNGWSDGWGFPSKRPLVVDVNGARAITIGRRAQDAAYFEDAIGNVHNYGPMGTTTIYALERDGVHIHFTDNGLPNDLSRQMCGPDDGRFVAETLSTSASAQFVIDRYGRMFTHFEDYDLNGGTPNFEYTYQSTTRPDDDGEALASSIAPYFLPLPDWRWQTPIAVTPGVDLSRLITVLQTGKGNAARQLRVAGRKDGAIGVFEKGIEAEAWTFRADPTLRVPDDAWLNAADLARGAADFAASDGNVSQSKLPRAPSERRTFRGGITVEPPPDAHRPDFLPVPGVEVELTWHVACSPAPIVFTVVDPASGEPIQVAGVLHTADFWSPARRQRPGDDGLPQLQLGTLVLPDSVLTDQRRPVRALMRLLRAHHQKTFGLLLSKDRDSIRITTVEHAHRVAFTLTSDPQPRPLVRGSLAWFGSSDLLALVRDPAISPAVDAPTGVLQESIARIAGLRMELRALLAGASQPLLDLEAFHADLGFTGRTVAPLLRLGWVNRMPEMLAVQHTVYAAAVDQAERGFRLADDVLAERVKVLDAELTRRGVAPREE